MKLLRFILSPLGRPIQTNPMVKQVFDSSFYRAQLACAAPSSPTNALVRPLRHYLMTGWRNGFNPHPFFDAQWYLAQNPDVAAIKMEPLAHYLTHGWKEDRRPHPLFDGTRHLARHSELLLSDTCPLVHWARYARTNQPPPRPVENPNPPIATGHSHYPRSRPYPYLDRSEMVRRIAAYQKSKKPRNKIALFTCITAGYDTLRLPEYLSPDIDYFLFTDRPTDGQGVFQVLPMPDLDTNPALASRYIKLHPHEHFKDYDLALWCDANVILRQDLGDRLAAFLDSGLPLAFVPHPLRRCIYREAVICALSGKDQPSRIVPQMLAYQNDGYPEDHGLIEGNFFACRPQHPATRAFFDAWWHQLSHGSRRDQLSANYVLWKQRLTYFPLLGEGHNTRTHPATALLDHGTYDASHYVFRLPENLPVPIPQPLPVACAFARKNSLPVRAFADLIAFHEHVGD